MNRRRFLRESLFGLAGLGIAGSVGCRGTKYAHVLDDSQPDMVGTTSAGAETFGPLVEEATARLLGRHEQQVHMASHSGVPPQPMRICFVGVENKSAEELLDFKDQIYQLIDTRILQSDVYRPISQRFVSAALLETRLRPDQLFLPDNMRLFTATLERQGQPFDYLLYATITSGTTEANRDAFQRDYLLTLEMINVRSGQYDKESASLRKGYHKTRLGKIRHYNPFSG